MADAPEQLNAAPAEEPRGAPPKRRRRWLRLLWLLPVVLVAAGATWVYRVARSVTGTGPIGGFITGITHPRDEFPGKDRILILIAGKDYNHTKNDVEYTTGSRSDTIMLLSADLATKKLSAVSIPRDMRVTAPDGRTGKINGTFQRGGIKLLAATIEQEFGVVPDYSVVLKADAVKAIVDELGGVEVDAIDRMFYQDAWDDLQIDIPKGHSRLNGSQAIGFVRFRKSGNHRYGPNKEIIPVPHVPSLEEGDLRRMDRTQQMIHAMLTEVKKPGNLARLPSILDVCYRQIETNLTNTQIFALANIFKDSSGGVSGTSVPGRDGMVDGTYYWLADIPRAKLLMQWILFVDESAGRHLARVVVYGGPGDQSAVREDVGRLSTDGFTPKAGVTRKALPAAAEVVYHADAFQGLAEQIAADLGNLPYRKEFVDPRYTGVPDVKVFVPASSAPAAPAP